MLNNIWTRIKISGCIFVFVFGAIGSVFTFPITYWLFGLSPEKIADWSYDTVESLKRNIR